MHADVNGIRIHYEAEGEGPWLVTSHSLACSLEMWRGQIAALRGRFRVLSFDTRGHGQSSAPEAAYTLDQLAEDLQALLDHAGIQRCHYMGLSMGGMIGMTHALKYPGRLQSLLLCDTTSRIPAEAQPVWQQRIETATRQGMAALVDGTLARWFTPGFLQKETETAKRVGDLIRATPVPGFVGCCHAIAKLDITDKLGAIQVPTMVVVGDRDAGTPVEASRAIHLGIPGAHLAVIPSASHLSNLEQPEAFDFFVGRFLESVR